MAKILVVEDNDNNLYLMKYLLTKKGHEVLEARTGREAIKRAQETTLDLILMDIALPDISGEETTRHIKEAESESNTPIIALTSYAMSGDKERFIEAGHDGYIQKPIDPEKFINEITQYLP